MSNKSDFFNVSQEKLEAADYKLDIEQVHADGTKDFYQLRKDWSNYICWFIVYELIIQGILVIAGIISQDDYLLGLMFTEAFVQVIGLALIVVAFLFKNHE